MSRRYSYQRLVELVGGDDELIARLVEEGEIQRFDDEVAIVNVDRVLIAQTLVRELEVDWAGVEVILRLQDELATARRRIAALESALAQKK
jgi:CO/xanthine dehydrogenase Mo-binding subunit